MRILTLENTPFDLDHLPEEVDDMRFAILDNSNPQDPDYHYIPLIFLESFNAPALVLRIGENLIRCPELHQLTHIEECGKVRGSGNLLGVVGHKHDRIVALQLIKGFFNFRR